MCIKYIYFFAYFCFISIFCNSRNVYGRLANDRYVPMFVVVLIGVKHKRRVGFDISFWNYCISMHKVCSFPYF